MNTSIEKLKRDDLPEGGFAGLREHRLVKDPAAFGPFGNKDGSWPGLGHFVYLADARFQPHGETRMHNHHEIDVISVIVDGRIAHQGSLENGKDLSSNDVQVQRAGGEGFSHNEINPDDDWNRMLQLWVLPEQSGQASDYRVYQPEAGKLTTIYGGNTDADFPAKTVIDVALLEQGQSIEINEPFIAYLSRGKGMANGELIEDGQMVRGNSLGFEAKDDVQLVVVHTS